MVKQWRRCTDYSLWGEGKHRAPVKKGNKVHPNGILYVNLNDRLHEIIEMIEQNMNAL